MSGDQRAVGKVQFTPIMTPVSNKEAHEYSEEVFVFPTSFAQQRLWFLDRLEPQSPAYNIPIALRLKGRLNVRALERSFNEIVRRHEVLRTTFAEMDGQPVQVIAPSLRWRLKLVDVQELPEADREIETRRLAAEEAQRPFDLAQGPLLRTTLVRLKEKEHVLLLTVHHIVSDGWSTGILFREISVFYESFSAGKTSPLSELPIQYADFAVWQREWLQGETLEAQLSYWREQLAGAPPSLEFPTDRPRPLMQTYRGTRQFLVLSEKLTETIKALSQRAEVTPFMTLLAAFSVLLKRYTGQDDIVVGTPIAGRNRPEIEGLIGFFVNTLVMRTDLSGNPGFLEVLGRVREVCLGAYAHQDVPFEKLVEELRPERNLTQSPMFQVMFVLQNATDSALELKDVTLNSLEVDTGTAKFDLALSVIDGAEGLNGILYYNTDLFDAPTINRILKHYENLLEGIVADPEQTVSTLPLLTETERNRILVEWNDTVTDYPSTSCIHQLFEAQVERTPEAIAVQCEKKQLTYRELNARANQLAHYLQTHGVAPEVLVGICLEPSLDMVVGMLGILKAGGAYVPLDPAYPKERLTFMLSDSGASILLTHKTLSDNLPEHHARSIFLDSDLIRISQEEMGNPVCGATAWNLAYLIYTSGTTGLPKGVLIEHRGLCNLVESVKHYIGLKPGRRVLLSYSFGFDASANPIFTTLCSGATIYLAPANFLLRGTGIFQTMRHQAITDAFFPPSFLAALPFEPLPLLQTLTVGAEACPAVVISRWAPGRRFFNAYGPTEATIRATVAECTGDDWRPTIGRPIANTQVYILDRHLQPVPIGVPGELHIGGVGLARGYQNQPELTAEKFIPNPFGDEPGARLYKTGDLARSMPDGTIDFLGRFDHQVKIRGSRIELGEIETTLGQHPAVREVVVTVQAHESGDNRLVAYVVADQHTAPTVRELRSFLQEKLPEYMVPSTFVMLAGLPLTPHGKVDRQALPAPDRITSDLERTFIRARDALESQLTKIWEKVLEIQPIGVRDNFFELGGHSLLAVRLFSEIKKVLGVNFPLSTLFQDSTVEDLAHVIRQEACSEPWSCLVPVQPGGTKVPFFCAAPAAGEAIGFANLARCLGSEQPFYGLELPTPVGALSDPRIEDMAAECIREIKTLQPEGPYLLGGACMGGLVAFEMACQLHQQGNEIAVLVLLDSSQPAPLITLRDYISLLLFHHLPRGHMAYCLMNDLREKGRKLKRKFLLSREGRRFKSVWKAHERARRTYVPRPYPGRITLFESREFHIRFPDYVNRWSALAEGGLDRHIIPCGHRETLREPHVRIVAEELKARLNGKLMNDEGHGSAITT
ncbi:MAG: amino acid adenylation domain-containing protein [Gemmatimonadota bacterium]|nr:MAG: amino acid adenylation domain-containing protein [Gemmatimonadota bacterium]